MDHFAYHNGTLHAEAVPVTGVAEAVGTPFYAYSTATLKRHYRVYAESFPGLDTLVCFAVKANSNPSVLHVLGKEGAGADVVSEGEIRLARAGGIAAEKIVFSGVAKTRAEMAYALKEGIFQFNVESEPELEALAEVASSLGCVAPVALRVNPDVAPDTHAKISTGGKQTKFGIPMETAFTLYQRTQSIPSLRVQGISVHIGSQLADLAPFEEAYKRVRSLAEQLLAEGIPITVIDLGGGLGIPYGNHAEPPLPAAYGEMVARLFAKWNGRLLFEPGRLIAGNAGILVSRVLYVKEGAERRFVILDAGMNDLMRPALYHAHHEIIPVKETSTPPTAVDIVGPVCETGDIFAEARPLPLPSPGDLLAFRSAGAYGAVMANSYNTRPLIPEVLVNEDTFHVIRPRPTYDDILKSYSDVK